MYKNVLKDSSITDCARSTGSEIKLAHATLRIDVKTLARKMIFRDVGGPKCTTSGTKMKMPSQADT